MIRKTNPIIAVSLTIAIFIADSRFPQGYAVWLLYVIPLLVAAPSFSRRSFLLFPLAITLLLIVGFLLSPENGNPRRAMVNRAAGAFSFWAMTFLISRRKQADEALERSYRELEERVDVRTAQLSRTNTSLQLEIAARKQIEAALSQSRAELQAILNSMADAVIFADTSRRILLANPAFTAQFGYSFEEVRGKTTEFLYSDPADYEEQGRMRYHTGEKTEQQAFMVRYRRKDGTEFWSETLGVQVRDSDGNIIGFAGISRDITERRRLEEELKHMARHDPLTGLPNRRFFEEIACIEMAQARRNRSRTAVLFLDLDRFKEINDSLGHEAGDALLREVAARLRSQVRESDTIARIGGDEFNILLADLASPNDGLLIARKILAALRTPFSAAGRELRTSASIGISLYPDDAVDLKTLLRYADIALYSAKEQGGNNCRFYNPALNLGSVERMRAEGGLQHMLERGELTVFYQPQVDAITGRILSAEALIRWRHPDLGLLEPGHFLAAAKETGFITVIDMWVLKTVCSQLKAWLDSGFAPVGAAVNLSARQFQAPGLVGAISKLLRSIGLSAKYLAVEIAESVAMNDIERTMVRLSELTSLGVEVVMDNFGYSSLNYLKRLSIQKLKIDQSLVHAVGREAADRTIITAITAVAHTMNIRVLAEGVETEEQAAFIRSAGCDEMQGFAAYRPMPADECRELFTRGQRAA